MQHYQFTKEYSYLNAVSASEKHSWFVDQILEGKSFDCSRCFVPFNWLGIDDLDFLDDDSRLYLNQIRAFSYIHMLGNYEDFITSHISHVANNLDSSNNDQLRALYRFCDEEIKHQQLFKAAEMQMESDSGITFERYFDAEKVKLKQLTDDIMQHPPLARAIILQAFEWGTQRHYIETSKGIKAESTDTLYADLLKAHWVEESQHVKIGALEIENLAQGLSADEIANMFNHIMQIAQSIGGTFSGQVEAELVTLSKKVSLTEEQKGLLQEKLMMSMNAIWFEVAMSNVEFYKMVMELSPEGAKAMGMA